MAVPVEQICVRRDGTSGDSFRFHCENCHVEVEKRAVGRVADMLLAAGAHDVLPPPLTVDDIDALRADLDAEDWMDRLLLA